LYVSVLFTIKFEFTAILSVDVRNELLFVKRCV